MKRSVVVRAKSESPALLAPVFVKDVRILSPIVEALV